MGAAGAGRHGDLGTGSRAGGHEALEKVRGQEGRVAGDGDDVASIRHLDRRPAHAGENAGERAGLLRDAVRDDRQAVAGEAAGIAVGVEDDRAAGPREAVEDAAQDRDAADGE